MDHTHEKKIFFEEQLTQSLQFGFVHNTRYQNRLYAPKLVINNPSNNQHVLTDIQEELEKCQMFHFNVAFVTQAGIKMLKPQLLDLANRGGHGRLLISPYLGFNDPQALRELLTLKNVEVRITAEDLQMHAKVYLFDHPTEQVVISGSSNLTGNALKVNYEWNVKLTATHNGEFIQQTRAEYERIWHKSQSLTELTIQQYEKTRVPLVNLAADQHLVKTEDEAEYAETISPNSMQASALEGLQKMRATGAKRALVISATGTGKTYLAAFDVRNYRPIRMLFIVHREQILRKAQQDFQRVIGFKDENSCIYRSGMDIAGKQYIFATIQSISQDKNLFQLAQDTFDYILIDEVHKAGAQSYQKFMNHFQPDFYLGMTATPERTDGESIYELFDYNIAYEIRLQQALAEDMLCPFLYFGVSEMTFDGELVDDLTTFSRLTSADRVNHIMEKVTYYGVSGETVKGLMFCSTKREAHELSQQFNQKGWRTAALTGEDSQEKRLETINLLETGVLDYILTVDIFNEGIDIPAINQVVMLRQTQSSIIFVQQLGRGLRKHPDKEYVTIIDFIGNYSNNYLIPVALFGDQTMNKDNFRRNMANRNQLEGLTTINFEAIAQKQIFDAITNSNLASIKILCEAYEEVKNRIGHVPLMYDFIVQNSIDPSIFFENVAFNHFGDVVRKFEKEQPLVFFTPYGEQILRFVVAELLNGKRLHEVMLLKYLIQRKGCLSKNDYITALRRHDLAVDDDLIRAAVNVLSLQFFKEVDQKKYGQHILRVSDTQYELVADFKHLLGDATFMDLLKDAIRVACYKGKMYQDGQLTVGRKYARKDACRLLMWDKDESSTLYGYRAKHGTCPIFVTYHKAADISEGTRYADAFINERVFHWYTTSKRTLTSPDVVPIIQSQELGIKLHLFVQKGITKGKKKDTMFYYLGEVILDKGSVMETTMPSNGEPVVTMNLELTQPVAHNLYHYIVETD